MKYVPKLGRIRNKPPKRSRTEEHAYTTSDTYTTDVIFGYRDPPSLIFRTGTGANTGYWSPTYSVPWDSNADLSLLGKLREKVAGSDFNAGIFLGEGREALFLITDSANRIYRSFAAAKKGNLLKAQRILLAGKPYEKLGRKTVASNWLELQYGWLPLLKDAESGAQFLAHQFSVPLQHTVKVSVRKTGTMTNGYSFATLLDAKAFRSKQIRAILKEKDVIALSGLTDPLSVAWELLPYSFVLDWFIPIGNYLSARGLSQSLSGTFVTTDKTLVQCGGFAFKRPSVTTVTDGRESRLSFKRIDFSRSISTTLSVPRPSVKPLSKVASWQHCANAVALLQNLK